METLTANGWQGERPPADPGRPRLVRIEDVAAGLGAHPDEVLAVAQRLGAEIFWDGASAAWISRRVAERLAGRG